MFFFFKFQTADHNFIFAKPLFSLMSEFTFCGLPSKNVFNGDIKKSKGKFVICTNMLKKAFCVEVKRKLI